MAYWSAGQSPCASCSAPAWACVALARPCSSPTSLTPGSDRGTRRAPVGEAAVSRAAWTFPTAGDSIDQPDMARRIADCSEPSRGVLQPLLGRRLLLVSGERGKYASVPGRTAGPRGGV